MKEIIKDWWQTQKLTPEQALAILEEYLSLSGRKISSDQWITIMNSGLIAMINWKMMATQICLKNGWYLAEVTSAPEPYTNHVRTICRYMYE